MKEVGETIKTMIDDLVFNSVKGAGLVVVLDESVKRVNLAVALDELEDEDRRIIFSKYCSHCGAKYETER